MTSVHEEFRKVLSNWIGEVELTATWKNGAPSMGKFEAEELYRVGRKFLEMPDEPVVHETLNRVGVLEVRERIYGETEVKQTRNVLQDWTQTISTRQQGVLIIALRGPDGVRKEDAAKPLVRTIRGMVMNAGRTGKPVGDEHWEDDPFMTLRWIMDEDLWKIITKNFFDQWDFYNVHFLQHLMHAFAVAGIHYPDLEIRQRSRTFYIRCCHKLHVEPESDDRIQFRLRDGIREEDGKGD